MINKGEMMESNLNVESKNFWEGLEPFERLPDRNLGVVVPAPEKVTRLWGEVRMMEPLPDRSLTMTNFVTTPDGVGSYGIQGHSGGGTISKSRADRWGMDMWRTVTDAVLIGAETIRAEDVEFKKKIEEGSLDFRIDKNPVNGFAITVEDPELADWREKNKGSRHPLIAIFSGSGELPEDLGIFSLKGQKIVIFTTPVGGEKLTNMTQGKEDFSGVDIIQFSGGREDMPEFALETLKTQYGVSYTVAEGGPGTIGDFLRRDLIDEVAITTAPRLGYGKDEKGNPRKRIFEGNKLNFYPEEAFSDPEVQIPEDAQVSPEFKEVSLRRHGDHIFSVYFRKRKD